MSCYNDELVYGVCCQSCVDLARWDLPDSCAWGDKQVWCVGIDAEQCNDQAIFGKFYRVFIQSLTYPTRCIQYDMIISKKDISTH